MKSFDPRLIKIFRKDGWKPGRDAAEVVEEYKSVMGLSWLPSAEPFVRNFGRLAIRHGLWVYPEYAVQDLPLQSRVEAVVGDRACPLAVSGYMGEEAVLWIDAKGRFYVVDKEGMVMVGNDLEEALGVLFLEARPPEPPPDLKEALRKAYEWDKIVNLLDIDSAPLNPLPVPAATPTARFSRAAALTFLVTLLLVVGPSALYLAWHDYYHREFGAYYGSEFFGLSDLLMSAAGWAFGGIVLFLPLLVYARVVTDFCAIALRRSWPAWSVYLFAFVLTAAIFFAVTSLCSTAIPDCNSFQPRGPLVQRPRLRADELPLLLIALAAGQIGAWICARQLRRSTGPDPA